MKGKKIFDRSNPLLRIISAILLVAFIAQDIAWADPQVSINKNPAVDKLAAATFLRSEKAIDKVSAKAMEYAIEEYSAIPRDKLDLACVRASLRNLLDKNRKWFAPHVSYSLISHDGLPMEDDAPDSNIAEVVVRIAPDCSVRYFDPAMAMPQKELAGYGSPVAINDRLHKQLLTNPDPSPSSPSNFSFGEGVGLRHMEVNNIIAFHTLTTAKKGKYYEKEFYERETEGERDPSFDAKIRKAADLLMLRSDILFAKGAIYAIVAIAPVILLAFSSFAIYGDSSLLLTYICGKRAHKLFKSAMEYYRRSKSIRDDTTIMLVDIPSHLLLSGKDEDNALFYQLTHIGRARRIIYIPKKALRDLDISNPRDMRQLATILNHDQIELDLMHKDNRIANARTHQEYEHLLTAFHDTAKLEDPFGEAARLEERIAEWIQMDGSGVAILKKEIDEKIQELEARNSNILDEDESKTENRFSYIYDTACIAMQIGYAYEVIGDAESARVYYGKAWLNFFEVVSTDVFILPIYAQLNIVRINTFEGNYADAAMDFKRITNYEIGVPHPHTKYVKGSVRVVERHVAENIVRWKDEVEALMLTHAQTKGGADDMEKARVAIKDITEATEKYLKEQAVFEERERSRANNGVLVEELRRAILEGKRYATATLLERLRERFEGTLPEEVERVVRETKSPTAAMIPDTDALSNYIYELEKGEENLKDADHYEKTFLKPLFDLFFSYLTKDFDGADEFIDYCRATISKSDAYGLRMQMNEKNKELFDKFSKIREKDGTEDASIELYGLLLFYLTSNSTPYLRHLYREFIRTRPLDEIAFARKGVSFHTRGDAIVYFYPKNILFEGREANTREGYRYGEAGRLEDAKDSPNAQKIMRAVELWKKAAEDKPHLAERIEHFETITSIVELDMKTSLLFSDPQHNVVRPVHAGRSRHRLYLSKNYLDNLNVNKDSDMKELAAWLNYGQNFLDTHDQMTADGYAIPRIQKALSRITNMFFDDEDTGLLSSRDLRERLASFMEEDFLIKYRDVLLAAIKEEAEAEVLMQGIVEPGKAAPHEYKLARNSFGHLLYRYEGLGLHSKADKAYMQMSIATSVIQAHEGGITPCTDQIELVLTALRFARWDDFVKELRTLLTGKGYPRPIEVSELPLLTFMLKGRFQNDLRHAIHAQKEAADPYSYHIVEKIEKEADKLLKEFSEHPFKDLGPQDVQNTTASLSFIGKAFGIRYSPFLHAPVFEESAKVGVPFGIFAILNAVNQSLPSFNMAIFTGALTIFGIVFIIAHLLNERAPPRSLGEAARLFAAPSAAAIAGGILSYVFFANPLYAILSSVLAHFAINVAVWIARRSGIDIKYSTILFSGSQRLTWAQMEQIRELSIRWGLNENGRKNLEDILKDPGAENIRRALFELLKGGTSSALSRLEMFKEKERGARSEFLGELVQAASCQRRIKFSKVIEMGPILAGAEIDAVIEVDRKKYASRGANSGEYDLSGGMYLMEGKVDEWGDVEYFISYIFDTKLNKYLRAAQALRKTGKEVSGIIFAVGGEIAKANAEEFRKIFIETGEADDEIRAAGFDPEKFKVYIHLVPETIYERGPKTALTARDIEYIDAVLKKPEGDRSVSRQTLGECRTVLERSLLLFGLERVRSVKMSAHFRERGVHLVGRSYDMHEYIKAILDLKRDIAEVEKDTTLIMDDTFIVEAEAAPVFEGNNTDRIRNPSLEKADFTLGQKTWGNFEMFISKDRKTVYVPSAGKGVSEYFSLNMDIEALHPLMYHSGDTHIALDAAIPAASIGDGRKVNMARIIGILREAIGFREEVLKHDEADYYWIDRLSGPNMALVSYDILASHKIPHLMELVGPHAVIPDFYALDEENRLELLAEFGRHSPKILGKKFAHGYHALVSIPRGRTPDNEKFDAAGELTLSASMSDRYLRNDAQFAKHAAVLAEEFLANLRKLAEEENVRMPMPRAVAVEDSYGNRKIRFDIDPLTRKIGVASAVETVRSISEIGLRDIFVESENIIAARTGILDISKVPSSRLLRYGYAKVVGSGGNLVIAPIEGMVQKPMPMNWVMGLPFTSKKTLFDGIDARREDIISHTLLTDVRFNNVDTATASGYINAFHKFLETKKLVITDRTTAYDVRKIMSSDGVVESVLNGIRWVAIRDATEEDAYFFLLMTGEKIVGHGRFRRAPGYQDVVEFMFYIDPNVRGKGKVSGKKALRVILTNIYHKFGCNVALFKIPAMARYDIGREYDRYQDIIDSGTPAFFVRAGFSPAFLSVKAEKRPELESMVRYVKSLRQGETGHHDFPFRYANIVLAQAPLLLAVPNMGSHSGPYKGRIEKQDEAIAAYSNMLSTDVKLPKREVVLSLDLPQSHDPEDEFRETKKINDFITGIESNCSSEFGGMLEDILTELIFNVMEHGLGGKLVVYMEKDASGRPEWLDIVASDNGPGLPEEPDKLVTKSLLASEDLGKHADDDAVLSDDGFELLEPNAYRGQGFVRIAFDPDSVTIEYNGRKFSRVTNDRDVSSWFGEEGESSVVSGTRFTLGFSLKYAIGMPVAKEDALRAAVPVPADLIDRRPVEAGLLASSFVEYDMAVKRVINPDNKPLVGLYCASGADMSNFLLSTNATEGYFVSNYRGRFKTITVNDLKECFESASPEEYIEKRLSPYYYGKFDSGYAGTETFYSKRETIAAMAFELRSIGVDLSTVKVDSRRGRPVLRFRWRYQVSEERDYSITLIDADAANPEEYAADLAGVAIDVYYQRAPNELPFEYLEKDESYIKWIYSRMKPGGYLITDDHAFDNNEQWYRDFSDVFPLPAKEVEISGLLPIEGVILQALRPVPAFNHEAAYYGWQMTVRQKPLDAVMVTDKSDGVARYSRKSIFSRIFAYARTYAISLSAFALSAAASLNDKTIPVGTSITLALGVFTFFALFQFTVNIIASKYEDAINAFWADILGVPHQKKDNEDKTKGPPTGMMSWGWKRAIPYLRSKGASDRWIASIGGIEELFFSGVMISDFAGLAHMFAMSFSTGLYIGFTASAILFTLAHVKEVYRMTGGVLTHAPPSKHDIAVIAGLGVSLRAVYLTGLILLPFGSYNIIIALPLTIALHSLYNAFIAPRLGLILGIQSAGQDRPLKEFPRLNASITKDTSVLIKQLTKSFGSSYLIMNSVRNLKAELKKYGQVKRGSLESCDLGIKRILATWNISAAKKGTLASGRKRIVKILAEMDKMDGLISRIEYSTSGDPELSAALSFSVYAIRLASIIDGIREENVHLIQRLEDISASIYAMSAGREEMNADKLHSYVRALKAISTHQGIGDKSCERIWRLADDMNAGMQFQASLFDNEDMALIDRLWKSLSSLERKVSKRIIGKLESKFGRTQPGDIQIIKEGRSFEIDEYISYRLGQYAKSLRAENDKELSITMSTINIALQNMEQHGDDYGAMILRARYISGKLDIQFVLLDRGRGFIDRLNKHAPIHEAVKAGKSFGKNGNGGIGLTMLVEVADKISITSVNSSLYGPETYYWTKGEAYESRLRSSPVERGVKTVFVKEIGLSVEPPALRQNAPPFVTGIQLELELRDVSDGFIRQGDRSLKRFEQNREKIESEEATARYKDRVIALVENAIAEGGLVGREREMLRELARTLRMDTYKIHTFEGIVESEDDFFLGWNYLRGSRMFLAVDIMAGLEERGPPSLVDEYLLHEALCPVLGHYTSIMLQQKLFPKHYLNELKLYWESPVKPYKGLLGSALRRQIDILSARRNAVSDNPALMLNIQRASQFSQSIMSSCSEVIAQHCRIMFSRDFGSLVLRDRDVIWLDERLCAEDSYTPGGLTLLAGALAYGATARFADSDLFERYLEEITAWSAEMNVYADYIARSPGAEYEMRELLARFFRSPVLRARKLIDLARDRAQKGALYKAGLFSDEGINEIAACVSMDEEEFVSVMDLRPVQHRILAPCYVGLNQEIRKTVNPNGQPLVGLYAGAGADISNFFLSTDCTDAYFVDKRAVDVMRLKDAHRGWMSRHMNNLYASTKYQYGYGQDAQLFNKFMERDGATVEMHLIEELRRMNVAKEDIWVETNAAGRTVLKFRWGYWGEKPKVRSITFIPANIKLPDQYPQDLRSIFKNGIDLYYQRAGMTIAEDYHLFLGDIGRSLKPGAFMVTDDNLASESTDHVVSSPDVYLNQPGRERTFTGDISPQTVEVKTWERIVLKPFDNRYGWKLAVRRKLSSGESAKGAYATSFEGRGLPKLSDLSFNQIHTLSKDGIASLIKIIEGQDDPGKVFDGVFDRSSMPEAQKLKATFLYMLRLSRANDKFKQLLLMALRSPPYGMDRTKGIVSSNLEISSMIFAISKNIPSDSARYFNTETGQVVIVFNGRFFNIDELVTDPELSDAVLHVRAERLLHELSHDNMAGPLSKEVAEEAKIIAYVDVPLSEVTRDIGMQAKIDRLLENRQVNRALHHSGRIFTLFPQWLKEKHNLSSREFNIWLHIVRRQPLANAADPVQGKAFPAIPGFDIVKWYFEEYRASQAEMAESFRDGALSGDDIVDWIDRVIRPIKADFDITGIVEIGKPFTHLQAGLLGGKVLKEILIPHGLIVHQSAVASGIAAGLIVDTEMITTPAGRTIPLYTVRTLEGDFGQGTAFSEYIIMPEEVARESRDIAPYYAKMWRDYQEKRRPAALFRYKKEYIEWIFMHLLGRTDANAVSRLVRECDLAEEISHSDMHAFAESILVRQLNMAAPEDVEAASHAILRPTSIEELAFEAARDTETRHTLAEAVLEVEAKLNAIIRSPMSAYNFLELLHGNVIDLHISTEEPPEYGVARNILLSVLSKHLFGHSTTDARQWRDYLDESLWNMDEFNAAIRNAAEAAYREEFLSPDERTKKITEGNVRRQQTAFFAEVYGEVVKPRFTLPGIKVLNICSGSNALAVLYATNCSEAVMIDRLPFGYRASMPRGTAESVERERYFSDIAAYDFPRTDTIGGIGALWYPLKWELAEMGIAEEALTIDNPSAGMWRVRFIWQHPDDSQARPRTMWFFEEDIPEAYNIADLAMVGRFDEQGVNLLDADILFDKAAEHTLQVTTELSLNMKRKSIVITDNPLRKKILDSQNSLVPVTLSSSLAEQSRYFGYVGKNTYEKRDALDVMAVYESRGTGSRFSGKIINIYNSAVLTGEERDKAARFVIQEGLDISTAKNESPESGYFVAFRGGEPVGITSYAILPEWLAADRGYSSTIGDLYVAENFRRQGIAAALVRQAEKYLRKKNVKNYYVTVGQGTLLQDFWKKFIPKEYQTLDSGGALLPSIVPFENIREISRLEACISAVKIGALQKGNIVDLRNVPPEKEIILVGDLHARVDNFGKILERADPRTGKSVYEKIMSGEAVLILLGDVIHNDPPFTDDVEAGAKHLASMDDSLEIMNKVMDLKTLYPDSVYYVLGNHDDPFATCLRGGIDQSKIYRETIRSRYGERYLDLYRALIRSSPVMVIAKGLVATHAAPIRKLSLEEIATADKDASEMHFGMWGRHESHFGDLEDIFGRSNPLLKMLYRSRKEQSYAARDVGEFLERVGQGQGIFIVGHTPDLIPAGNFYVEIEDRHYIIYAARDDAGYASYTNGELTFVPVARPEVSETPEQVSVPVSQSDPVDKFGSFIKLKQELKTRFARLAQGGISTERVADVFDEKSVDIFQAIWELKNTFAASSASDDSAQEDMCYEVSLAACEAFDEAMPGHEVSLVSGYYSEDGPEPYRTPHFWVLIDDDIVIDLTYGQFDSDYQDIALITRNSALSRFKLEKGKALPWKSVIPDQLSGPAVISSIHDVVKVDASKQGASKILLSTSLFDDIDRSNLERLFNGTNIEIVEPGELKRRTMNEHSSKENLAIVLTQEDFKRGKTWSGAEEDYRVKSSMLIVGDKLTGSNYLYLEGVIELAKAMMRSDKNGIKEYYKLISGIALSDEVLGKLNDSPNTIAFAINAILKFRPIQVHDNGELERYKSMVEGFLIEA